MELKLIYGGGDWCKETFCPTVFKSDRDTFVIQGYVVENASQKVPAGETLIELPKEFIEEFIKEYNKKDE